MVKAIGKIIEGHYARNQYKYFILQNIVFPAGVYLLGRYVSQEQKEAEENLEPIK